MTQSGPWEPLNIPQQAGRSIVSPLHVAPKRRSLLDKVYFAKRDKMYSYLDIALYLLLVLFAFVFRVLPSAHQGLQYVLAFEKKVIE